MISCLDCTPGRWKISKTEKEEEEEIPGAGLSSLDHTLLVSQLLGQLLHECKSFSVICKTWNASASPWLTSAFSDFQLHFFSLLTVQQSRQVLIKCHRNGLLVCCESNPAYSFRTLLFRICAICVFEHFNGASSHLQLLTLRILPFFTVQFYRLLGVMLRLVILPQQAKRKCQKLALLLFKRVYFLFL